MEIPITFLNNKKQKLTGTIHKPKKYSDAIIFLHGFPSSQNGSTSKNICKSLMRKGYLTMRFSFTGCDDSEGDFSNKLLSEEIKDVKKAIDYLTKNYAYRKLILIGHSTGAIIATLYAHKDKRINKTILLAPTSDLKKSVGYDFTSIQVHDLWMKGYTVYNRPDKSWLHKKKIKKSYYDEFFKLDLKQAIKKYHRPLLIVHGDKDEAIPLWDAKQHFLNANKPKEMVILKRANHKFETRWPSLIKTLINFIEKK